MSAARPMYMITGMRRTVMPFCALCWVGGIYFDFAFVIVAVVLVVQMTIVDVIRVSLVLDSSVSTAGSVFVVMVFVYVVSHSNSSYFSVTCSNAFCIRLWI